jgi:outer membrane protein assembly factor BamA
VARRVQTLGFWTSLKNPPAYDSLNADKSVIYMRALLNSLGYFRDTITYKSTQRIVRDKKRLQYRTYTNFSVYPGTVMRLDSISYDLNDDTLQKITLEARNETVLKRGDPFAQAQIGTELDRLTDVYRNNGYLRFTRDELLAVFDTVGLALLRPTLDPLEQAEQFEALRRRRENPTANIDIVLRANEDSTRDIRYYVGNTTIYPDLNVDTAGYTARETVVKGYRVLSYKHLYEPRIFPDAIYLKRGELYSQRNYLKTLNRFNAIGSWRLVAIDQVPRTGSDTVDFVMRLTPANKYSFNANVEGSQNLSNNINPFTSGNLISINLGLQNRNFARRANLASTNIRFGTEVSAQRRYPARQASFSHTIFFPRLLPDPRFIRSEMKENAKTLFGINTAYSTSTLFDLTTVNTYWGYDFNWNKTLLSIRMPNIEYTYLRKKEAFRQLEDSNRSYAFIFNSGLVTSMINSLTLTGGKKNTANLARFGLEFSGILTGFIPSDFLRSNLQRFIKLDAEFRQTYKIRKSAFAWRVIGGAGFQIKDNRFEYNRYLPFYRSYIAGGANSMRAWALRRLGPGSTVLSFDPKVAPWRFGEMALEANAEYRFFIAEVFGFQVNSALFTDMGNVWYLRKDSGFPDGTFRFSKLWNDIAIGTGTGLRVDIGFFLVRVDYAFKMKDPSPEDASKQNKFFADKRGVLQLGVTYPF